ncbi:hypothetical protein DSO57_1011760 [Entomophthora muscae]|uniref:Uncharacterized protein n=1 Tax=Entomophthora muscae TaxID=34485 RepID=A0ACC2SVB6_9FUNG|nr:hypothetical protein DSO57_1011760 [Entomophthora muscae]
MNHLIFSAVLTSCLGIGGHQYNHQQGPYNKPPEEYFYKEPAQLNSSKQYSWPTLVSPCSTQSVAIYTCVYYVLTYFASNFGRFNVHTKVFRCMMMVYPIVPALTGFQVANLVPYLAKILPHILGLYIGLQLAFPIFYQCSGKLLACFGICLSRVLDSNKKKIPTSLPGL